MRIRTNREGTRVDRDGTGKGVTKGEHRADGRARGSLGERDGRAVDGRDRRTGGDICARDDLADRQTRGTREPRDCGQARGRGRRDRVVGQCQRAVTDLHQGAEAREHAAVGGVRVIATDGEGDRRGSGSGVRQGEVTVTLQAAEGGRGERAEGKRAQVSRDEVQRAAGERVAIAQSQRTRGDTRVTRVGIGGAKGQGAVASRREATRASDRTVDG